MHFLTEDEAKSRLERDDNAVDLVKKLREERSTDLTQVEEKARPGRKQGDLEVPQQLREIIAIEAQALPAAEVARAFNVSESTVNDYKKGYTRSVGGRSENESIRSAINQTLEPVREKALDRLMSAMNLISDEVLSDEPKKALQLAQTAANLSRVMDKAMPKEAPEDTAKAGVQLIVFAPTLRQEEHYEVIEVGHATK